MPSSKHKYFIRSDLIQEVACLDTAIEFNIDKFPLHIFTFRDVEHFNILVSNLTLAVVFRLR